MKQIHAFMIDVCSVESEQTKSDVTAPTRDTRELIARLDILQSPNIRQLYRKICYQIVILSCCNCSNVQLG